MKLNDELKKQAENAAALEEKREDIGKAGLLRSDDELDQVSGGGEHIGRGGVTYWTNDGEGNTSAATIPPVERA